MVFISVYDKMKTKIFILVFFALVLALFSSVNFINAAADFQVTGFSCSPSEVGVNTLFSCTATIKNNGDASGSVSIATLYPDAADWLEDSTYPESSGESVSPGSSTEVTFSGLRATKSGDNGFSKIMLDSVTDTYVADVTVNVINVAVTVSNSESSAAVNAEITTTVEVTAGGNIDVSLSFATVSGGCSIGSQSNPKSITGMTDGSRQSRTWTVTQTSSGSCNFRITASATGSGGVATIDDSTTSSITCTNCPSSSSSSSSGGGGGGGVAGAETGDFTSLEREMAIGDITQFKINNNTHSLTLLNLSATSAVIAIESEKQEFNLSLGDTVKVDLNSDGINDLFVQLKAINVPLLKATFYLENLNSPSVPGEESESGKESEKENGAESKIGGIIKKLPRKTLYVIIIIVLIAIPLIIWGLKRFLADRKFRNLASRVKVKKFTPIK